MLKKIWYSIFGDPEWRVAGYTKQQSFSVTDSKWHSDGDIKCRAVVLVNKHDRRNIKIVYDEYNYSGTCSDMSLINKILSLKKQNLIYSSISTKKLNTYDGFDLCEHHEAFYDWEAFNNDFVYGVTDLSGRLIEKSEAK